MTEADWLSARDLAFHPAVISWGAGFDAELAGPDGPYRWCSGSGELILTNPGDSPHPVVLSMRCIPGAGQPCELRVDSPLWTERFASPPEGVRLRHTLILPPGESRFTFSCDGPPVPSPTPRRLVFLVQNTTLQPVSQADGPASGAEPGRRPSESSESTENPAVSGPRP
jgi:hypothetical protein